MVTLTYIFLIMRLKLIFIYVLLLNCSISYGQNLFKIKSRSETKHMIEKSSKDIIQDAKLRVPQIIVKYGYPCEIRHTITKDGYILEMHRIPFGRNKIITKDRPAVFMQHGLLSSSAVFVLAGPEQSLGFLLADAGYDVWLGNIRGNTYSRRHIRWHPELQRRKFWDFSFHEMGVMDLPAMIDDILKVTQREQIFYVGHSMGTTVFYVMCAEKPEYNKKIIAMFSLASVAYTQFMFSPIMRFLARFTQITKPLSRLLGIDEFLPHSKLLNVVANALCVNREYLDKICRKTIFAVWGFSPGLMNETLFPVLFGHSPAGTSYRTLDHYAQGMKYGTFRQYNYSPHKNLKMYGSLSPPKYIIRNIDAPIYIFHSNSDWISSTVDLQHLLVKLPNVLGKFIVGHNKYNHGDYIIGVGVERLVYAPIIELMKRHH